MFKITTLNKIAHIGLSRLDKDVFSCTDEFNSPDGVLVRSASMLEMDLPSSLLAIARAGAGVNNIPIDKCSEAGIVVFNTPGANANAVKELVIAALFLSSRKISAGIDWAKTLKGKGADVPKLVEKGKSEFGGPEIEGKKLGVIGLGAIGVMVANAAYHLGMDVLGFDPYISVDAAWGLSSHIKKAKTQAEIFEHCDYITIHVPLNPETKGMVNSATIATMKKDVRILNFSRAELVNNDDIKAAIENGKVACYVTDFPTDDVLNIPNIIAIPHLGASTPESEDNCAVMAVDELSDYLLNGNIKNSVNLPNVDLPRSNKTRICIIHKNIPNMLSQISSVLGNENVNIDDMLNKSKNQYAYTLIDIGGAMPTDTANKLLAIEGVLKVRVL